MAREYRIQMGAYDIGKWEYREVEALARRYSSMKRRADVLEKCNAMGVHGEEYAAMRWECGIVEQALRETAGGRWADALRKTCCEGVVHADLEPADMPTSNRNEFFEVRREFYWRLWEIWQKRIGALVKTDQAVKSLRGI